MKKGILFLILLGNVHLAFAQCKGLNLSVLKQWLFTDDKLKPALITQAGFERKDSYIDAEAGLVYTYTACWVEFKDGYNRYYQSVMWYPKLKMLSLVTLDKNNYTAIYNKVKSFAKLNNIQPDKTEMWIEKGIAYTFQVVDFNEPLQKAHPSYTFSVVLMPGK